MEADRLEIAVISNSEEMWYLCIAELDSKWLTKELCWKVSSDKNLACSHTILDTRPFFNSDVIQVGQQQGDDKESWTVFCQWSGPSW